MKFLTLVVLVGMLGCGGSDSMTAPDKPITNADLAGTYVLKSLNNVDVPAPLGNNAVLAADTLRLTADGIYTVSLNWCLTSGELTCSPAAQNYVATGSGTWLFDGGTLVISNDVGTFSITKSNGVISLLSTNDPTDIELYVKIH